MLLFLPVTSNKVIFSFFFLQPFLSDCQTGAVMLCMKAIMNSDSSFLALKMAWKVSYMGGNECIYILHIYKAL